jgi:hypothetical protein
MFPNELQVTAAIRSKHKLRIERLAKVLRLAIKISSAGHWDIRKKRGIDEATVLVIAGLLIKTCKTVRAIQILSERGFSAESNALVRVQFETALAILFILQKRSKLRTQMYLAHCAIQDFKVLSHWKETKRLKRKVKKDLFERVKTLRDSYLQAIPNGIDVGRHWSGRDVLQTSRSLGMEEMYATVYRPTSANTHASDLSSSHRYDQKTGKSVLLNVPSAESFDYSNVLARTLHWAVLSRVDSRLGLGYANAIEENEVTNTKLDLEQWLSQSEPDTQPD